MAQDYTQIDAGGRAVGREEVLASFRSGGRNWDEAQSDDHEVRIYGDVAVVVGRWRATGTNTGEAFDYAARYVSVPTVATEGGKWSATRRPR